MSTTSTGRTAEMAAADYLGNQDFKIIDQNWRTRVCEIDLIASHKKTIYFVEVKYRQQNGQGRGIEYITPANLKQMGFAAELWVVENGWHGDYQLAAIEVSGAEFEITNFIETI